VRPLLLCLHGWGGSKESFNELRAALKDTDIEILTPDLPGFGEEPEPSQPWNTDQYAEWVVEWMQRQNRNQRPIFLLGHSHGGRIALKIVRGRLLPVTHLFLCASAGIRRPRHFKRLIGLTLAKAGKFFLAIPGLNKLAPLGKKLLYKLVRVHDYEKASPIMRETLIRVTAEDLRPLLSLIPIPTDLFWGEDDRMTPVGDAHVMHEGIKNSQLHLFPGVRHAVHKDRATEIAARICEVCAAKA
jgi:pimeloyl-ACP methyl ester carboxylesterase